MAVLLHAPLPEKGLAPAILEPIITVERANRMGTSNRRTAVVVLGSLALVILLFLIAENAFNLKFLSPNNTGSILLFSALSGISFLLFLMLVVLLLRNILKLYASGQSRVLGSRLRARMLLGALLLSVVPAFFMLSFNYLLMNRSIDRWFSQPVAQLRDKSTRSPWRCLDTQPTMPAPRRNLWLMNPKLSLPTCRRTPSDRCIFRRHKVTLQGGFVAIYRDGKVFDKYQFPTDGSPVSLLSSVRPNEQAQMKPDQIPLC